MPRAGPRYTEGQARAAIAASLTYTEALRRLGMCTTGGARHVLRRYAQEVWRIPTEHFDPDGARRFSPAAVPLAEILVASSTYSNRRVLKERLYAAGLKARACELCGQGELWRGTRMSLILDHVNGIRDDNRLENLRIVCPNCNATLETHCGRNLPRARRERECLHCGVVFNPRSRRQRYCSRTCGQRASGPRQRPGARRSQRPPYTELLAMIAADGYEAVGRRFGVSGNAIRKWRRAYEDDAAASADSRGATGDVYPAAGG